MQIGIFANNSNVKKQTQEQQEQTAIGDLKSGYDKLKTGMSYGNCVSILGSNGELVSKSESEYFRKTQVYRWKPYEDALFTGIEVQL